MADSRAGAGNIQNEPTASYSARKYRGALKKHTQKDTCQRDTGAN